MHAQVEASDVNANHVAESLETSVFVPLLNHNDYEIRNFHPFTIRNRITRKDVKEWDNGNGYIRVSINNTKYYKHRIVALQFIHNDDPALKNEVDHINRDRSDYHIENLRWVSTKMNLQNRGGSNGHGYEFVDSIPDDAIVVDEYNGHAFEDLYYNDNKFYFYNGIKYRVLYANETRTGVYHVNANDVNGNRVKIYYSKFKRIRNIE